MKNSSRQLWKVERQFRARLFSPQPFRHCNLRADERFAEYQ